MSDENNNINEETDVEYFKITDLCSVNKLDQNDLFLVSHVLSSTYDSENVSFNTLTQNIKDNLSSEFAKIDHSHSLSDITDYVEPPSSYENLSVTNLSSEKIIIKEKGDNLVPIAIEQLSALEYPDKRYSNLYIYNISNDTSASWGSGYNNNYATNVYIGYNPKTRKCHTDYSGLYVPTIDTTRNIDNYLSNRTSVTTYQLNAKVTYTPTLLPSIRPYTYERDDQGDLWEFDSYLSVANLAIVDFPGYTKSYPAAINFLSSKYSPYTFSLKNADFYRLKILKNDVSGNLSVNNITGKNAYFDNLSGININIDDVINTDEISAKTIYTDDIIIKNFKPVDLSKAQRKTKIVTGVNWDLTLENDYPIVYFPNLNQNEYDFSTLNVSDKELEDGVYTWELICKSSITVANITVGDSENIKYVGTDLEEGKINGEQFNANTTVVFAVRLIKYNDTNIWNINYCYKF